MAREAHELEFTVRGGVKRASSQILSKAGGQHAFWYANGHHRQTAIVLSDSDEEWLLW